MTGPASRRGFLRGLTTLPLIGGGVTLIGNPSAAAEPITPALLDSYDAWLFYERANLQRERWGVQAWGDVRFAPGGGEWAPFIGSDGEPFDTIPAVNGGRRFHSSNADEPSTRAALVLSAVGCDWREGRRHG